MNSTLSLTTDYKEARTRRGENFLTGYSSVFVSTVTHVSHVDSAGWFTRLLGAMGAIYRKEATPYDVDLFHIGTIGSLSRDFRSITWPALRTQEFAPLGLVEFRNKAEIERFRAAHPEIDECLRDAVATIRRYFPTEDLALEIVRDPDARHLFETAFLYIRTSQTVQDAMKLSDLVDKELFSRSGVKSDLFCITLEFK